MKRIVFSYALMGAAAFVGNANAEEVLEFSPACETALALAAGPAYMRDKAGVYILGEDGYEKVRDSKNGYVCMVTREGAGIAPQCFDKVGQDAHVKVHLDEAKKIRAGVPDAQIKKEREEGFASGKYQVAQGHGVVYMASAFNYLYPTGEPVRVRPHVMYHAPDVTDKDLASVRSEAFKNNGMPFMNDEGPLGFMISFVDKATDSTEVMQACAGELPDDSKFPAIPE